MILFIEGCVERLSRKAWRCTGNGARPAAYSEGHTPTIEIGQLHVEFVGESPPYQSGSRVCIACAKAFYRVESPTVPEATQS